MKLKRLYKYWPLIILTLLGFILRIYALNVQSYWIDEAFSINGALAILEHGKPLLDSGIMYSRAPLFHYPLAALIGIFGLNEFSTRIMSVLFGTAFIPLLYFFTLKIANKKVALTATAIWTFFSLGIAWSRQARMYMMLTFFFFLALLFLVKFSKTNTIKYGIYCSLATIGAILSHTQGYALLLIYLIYLPVIYLNKPKKTIALIKNNIKAVSALILLALGIVWIKKNFIISVFSTQVDYFNEYIHYLSNEYFLLFYFALASVLLLRRFQYAFLIAIAFILPFYFVVFHHIAINLRYIFFILPIVIIFASQGIIFLIENLNKYRFGKIISVFVILCIAFSLFSAGTITLLPRAKYSLEPATPQPDFKSAYNFVSENIRNNSTIISSYSPLAKIYLGKKPDYTFDISLSGHPDSMMSNKGNPNTEIYNNVTLVKNITTLEKADFIIVDSMAAKRISPRIQNFLRNTTTSYKSENIVVFKNLKKENNY
ncbi:MAG: ArnT family glycosyltransferase [Nanoarchaeota archaeon]